MTGEFPPDAPIERIRRHLVGLRMPRALDNPQGAVTIIPTCDADDVAQTRDGLQAAAVFVPVIKDTEHD